MEIFSPKQKSFLLAGHLGYYIVMVGLFIYVSCSPQQPKLSNRLPAAKYQSMNRVKYDSAAPLKVTFLTSLNQPKIIRAGKPAIVIDSAGMGAPFFTNYTIDDGLPINFITYCMQDREGNIWIATGGGGACKIQR